MKCNIIRDLLPLYCDKLTSQDSNEEIEKHLHECEECNAVYESMNKKVPTAQLNDKFLPLIENYPPPAWKGKYIKIKYCTQLPNTQIPTFVFFANLPQYVKEPYRRFLENKLREWWDFEGTPVQLFIRAK
jgi:GTP-binding protein